jgi:S-adenosylmethionine:tRNA ribosyltransferase-isomerase
LVFFDYELPEHRIAQRPIGQGEARSSSKLLLCDHSGAISDRNFSDLPLFLPPGALVVMNDTAVMRARVFLKDKAGNSAEVLLLRLLKQEHDCTEWMAIGRPMNRLKPGVVFDLNQAVLRVADRLEESSRPDLVAEGHSVRGAFKVTLESPLPTEELLTAIGSIPLPPYIRNGVADEDDNHSYQSVVAENLGSAAAPTASLHFTDSLLERLRNVGVQFCFVTLHIGPASFQPLKLPLANAVSSELFRCSADAARAVLSAKREARPVVAVGTTVLRTLESLGIGGLERRCEDGSVFEETALFIKPGFDFSVTDQLITNFHQPRTTHLLLVNAFIGEEQTRRVYEHGLKHDYRFLSYGDAMLLRRHARMLRGQSPGGQPQETGEAL